MTKFVFVVVVVVVFSAVSVLLRLPSAVSFTTVSLVALHRRRLQIVCRHDCCDRIPLLTVCFSFAADKSGGTNQSNDDKTTSSPTDDATKNLNKVVGNEEQRLAARINNARSRAQQFVDSIMRAVVDPIPDSHGMAVVRNVFDLETGELRDIVIRNITIPFWQVCMDVVDMPGIRLRVAAVGTPGIGKTTSTPWLIRMLLEKRQTVVYLIRSEEKSKWYYEFVPNSDGTITVNVFPETDIADSITSLCSFSTYFIVDPGQSKYNCNPITDLQAKVILVPSPNSGHWGGSEFEKKRGTVRGVFRYFPTWSYEELLLAQPILRPDMTEDQVRERFYQFGGVPRHIFETIIEDLLVAQDRAVRALTTEQANDIALGQVDALDTFGNQAKSALLAFRLSENDAGTFKKGESYIVSFLASEKIYVKFQRILWNEMLQLGPIDGGWVIFEMIARHRIANGEPPREFQGRRCVGKSDRDYSTLLHLTLGTGKKEIRQVTDPLKAATTCENVVFHPISLINRLFDFLYKDSSGHFRVFQVTLGTSHTANVTHIKALEEKVGDASKISFYFLVPSERFRGFTTSPVKPAVACDVYHVMIPKPVVEQRQATDSDDDDQSRGGSENGRESSRGDKEQREATKGDGDDRGGGDSKNERERGADEQSGDGNDRSGADSKNGRKSPRGAQGKKATTERKKKKKKKE